MHAFLHDDATGCGATLSGSAEGSPERAFDSEVLKDNHRVLKELTPGVGVASLDESCITLAIKPYVAVGDYGAAGTEIYQAVVEKFPDDPIAVDAQYQIGYIWSKASTSGTYDPAAANHSKVAFEDFLARYPNSEKASQAKQNLKKMEHKQSSTAYDIAKFYDKQKQYRAAAIYYNEVIEQNPRSDWANTAQRKLTVLAARQKEAPTTQ